MGLRAIEYEVGGTRLTGYLADGSSGRAAPGVLVAHEAIGVCDHTKARTEALAEQGYVAFALDLYGEADLALEEARKHSATIMATPGLMHARAAAALTLLSEQRNVDRDRLAAVGFCQGGVTVLELARHRAPIRCAVGFHPGLTRPAGSPDGPISAKILMLIGDQDPIAPPEDRIAFARAMDAAGADWQLHLFGGVGHSFTNPAIDALGFPGFRYDERASRRAWSMMLDLLSEAFG